jgi:cytochrome P450
MNHAEIDQALSDPGFFVDHDPHPLWRQLRQEDPVHWTEDQLKGFWSITRYDDIIAVVSAPALFHFSPAHFGADQSRDGTIDARDAWFGRDDGDDGSPAARGDAACVQPPDAAARDRTL